MCLAVTYRLPPALHLALCDRDLLRVTAVTQGWNVYQDKCRHRQLTLDEKKILPPLLSGLEPESGAIPLCYPAGSLAFCKCNERILCLYGLCFCSLHFCLCICLCLSVYLCLCLYLSVSICRSVSVLPLCVCLPFSLSAPPPPPPHPAHLSPPIISFSLFLSSSTSNSKHWLTTSGFPPKVPKAVQGVYPHPTPLLPAPPHPPSPLSPLASRRVSRFGLAVRR